MLGARGRRGCLCLCTCETRPLCLKNDVPKIACGTYGTPGAGTRTVYVPWRSSCPVPQALTLRRRLARVAYVQYGGSRLRDVRVSIEDRRHREVRGRAGGGLLELAEAPLVPLRDGAGAESCSQQQHWRRTLSERRTRCSVRKAQTNLRCQHGASWAPPRNIKRKRWFINSCL